MTIAAFRRERAAAPILSVAAILCGLHAAAPAPAMPQEAEGAAAEPSATQASPDATDASIRDRLEAVFERVPALGRLSATVSDGVVAIEGTVADSEDEERVVELAETLEGVVYVDSRIEVRRPFGERLGDAWGSLVGSWRGILPAFLVALGFVGLLWAGRRVLEHHRLKTGGMAIANHVLLGLTTLIGVVAVIMLLPIDGTTRGQLLSLLGLLLTAVIALSSTTIIGNAMAGLMIRAVRNFRSGDWLLVGEHFGRVSERGLFHTEIQTETRELTTLPNLYLVSHPVTVTRSSGTLVTTKLSLGYDVDRTEVEACLIRGAAAAGLADAVVHLLSLGDFSVTYRVAGFLEDVTRLVTARARLNAAVMDALHQAGIEIVSPSFMNTRAFPPDERFVSRPKRYLGGLDEGGAAVEDMAFDKAEGLVRIEETREALAAKIAEVDERLKNEDDEEEKSRLRGYRDSLANRARVLEARLTDPDGRRLEG